MRGAFAGVINDLKQMDGEVGNAIN